MSDMSDEEFLAIPPEQAIQNIENYVDDNYGNGSIQEQPQQSQYEPPVQNDEQIQQQEQQEINPEVYKEAYDYIMQPFKAAGKEFQLRDFHEARGLMQQGIDYTKKQQQLKPRLMEMRALENNGMLGDNLNYAIDLFQGKPEAVAKLIKDKNIDLNSLQGQPAKDEWGNPIPGSENTKEYVPVDHKISENQYELEMTIQDLKQSPAYSKISEYLTSIDDASGSHFFRDPKELKALQQLAETGIHDEIIKEIEYLRAVNNPSIAGLNDYDAYNAVGKLILDRRMATLPQQGMNQNAPVQQQVQPMQQQPYPYNNQQPQLTPAQQQQMYQQYQQQMQMQQRKQSVSPIRNNPQTQVVRQYDPLFSNVSDEDFAKININDLMRN
jgi:hypothetical protein